MRRLMPIAAFALFLTVPLWAQHGGGHGGAGHVGGFSGHSGFSGGHSLGGHVSGGMRSGSGVTRGFAHGPSFSQRSFPQRNFSQRTINRGFRGNRFHHRGFRNFCNGFACGNFYSPYAYAGYYDPYWYWDHSSSYDEDYDRDRALANEMNAQSLAEQRDREGFNNQNSVDRDPYQSRSAAPREPENTKPQPATLLVFRDQHKKEIRNYAIIGQTLWSFASQRTEKIPLFDLDLTETAKANDARGLSFVVPAANQAQ